MKGQLKSRPPERVEYIGRSGVYPISGPLPASNAPVRGQGELAHPEERHAAHMAERSARGHAAVLALGRAIFGGFFLYNGINHFLNRRMLIGYARSKQVPMAEAAVLGSGALLTLGALSLLTGARPKIGASLIATFLLGVSPKMHDFWNIEDETQRTQELIQFSKNIALIGGACFAAAVPEPWPASPDLGQRGAPIA